MRGKSEVFHDPFPNGRWVGPPGEHFDGRRFKNLVDTSHAEARDLARWMLGRKPGPWREVEVEPGPPPPARVEGLRVTFIGHATCLVQVGGLNVLTDPVYATRIGPVSFAGPRRFRAPGIRFEDLPPIDLVLLSHDHFDHLCEATTRRLAAAHGPVVAAGLGNAALLARYGVRDVRELDWWESTEVGGAKITFVPAQHFSGRGLRDRDHTLWGGFVLESPAGRVYFAGDTGMGPAFAQIRERLGAPDLALLPIGAFRPEWFMSRVHIGPAEAVEVARLLGAAHSVPIHFGTFRLADDGMEEPLERLTAALAKGGPRFDVLREGEALDVPVTRAPRTDDASPG